jgi:hypothetical protein
MGISPFDAESIRDHLGGAEWNPLTFLPKEDESEDELLDLDEMHELGTKTRDVLFKYGLPVYKPRNERVTGYEVGDDRKDQSRSAPKLAAALVCQTAVVEMATSWEDTVLSTNLYNFCEVTSFVPCAKEQSFHYARKIGDFSNLGFIDSIVLRIILDVAKGDMSHSSTPTGKMTLLGSRVSTPRAEFRPYWMLASFLQDAYLRTNKANDPKYLPGIMGGAGVPVLFDRPENLYLFVKAYRGGKYSRVYGTATAELEDCLNLLEKGKAASPVFSLQLRDRQEYLHGTYAEKVFIPTDSSKAKEAGRLPDPIYESIGGINRIQNVENRLIRSRQLVGRRAAEQEIDHTIRLRQVLRGYWDDVMLAERDIRFERMRARARFDDALSANSAIQSLLSRKADDATVKKLLGDKAFHVLNTGQRKFYFAQAVWIANGGRKDTFTIADLSPSEDMFIRSEVSTEESFRVPGIPLLPVIGRDIVPTTTRAKVGLYEISQSQEEWCQDKTDSLVELREVFGQPIPQGEVIKAFTKDLEWVNDDTGLISQCVADTSEGQQANSCVILVSGDRKLGYKMANTANCHVALLSPDVYIKILISFDLDINDGIDLNTLLTRIYISGKRRTPSRLYIDTGSLAAQAAHFDMEEGCLVERRLTDASVNALGFRSAKFTLTKTETVITHRVKLISPIERPKMFRHTSAGVLDNYRLSLSETGNWRARSETGSSA